MYYTIRNVHVMAVCHVCHVMSNVHVNGSQSCIINVKYICSNKIWLRAERKSKRELPRVDTQTLTLLLTRHGIIYKQIHA